MNKPDDESIDATLKSLVDLGLVSASILEGGEYVFALTDEGQALGMLDLSTIGSTIQ